MSTSDTTPILYSYYRSSCAYRVRLVLNLKNIVYQTKTVNLVKEEAASSEHKKLNPKGEVPVLIIDGKTLSQSIAIIEYIDETHQVEPRLVPADAYQRYQVRMICAMIGSGIQPYQNRTVLNKVGDETKKTEWAHYYNKIGFDALEKVLEETAGKFCVGDQISIADCCLIPQIFNARRFKVDLTPYPTILAIEKRLVDLPAFKAAHPTQQPDCPEDQK